MSDERQDAELAQAMLAAIVESADDPIIGKTLDGIVTTWNRGAEIVFGYKAEEIIGRPIVLLIPPDRADEEARILERLCRGEQIEHYETQRVRKDGRILDVSLSVSPIRDKSGRVIGASKIARDITERKRVEAREREALREAQLAREQAEAANRAKDEFIATVSHELRTPLTAVMGWIRMLAAGKLDAEQQKKAIDVIDRNVRAQAQLIEDLLDISRITSGKLRIEVKPVELSAVINAAVEAIRPAADAKNIRIQTVLDSTTGPVSGDFDRLQQVMWNLLSNAIKFTPKGGRVQVELTRPNSHVEISVHDTGVGIEADSLPYVFNRFSQADSSITRSFGGLGMGLAIAKSIVEVHGGTIAASSPGKGKGATFTVKLAVNPVHRRAPRKVLPEAEPASTQLGDMPKELQGLSVLFVDDEADTCDMLRILFERAGAVVKCALSADEALQIMESWKPDILVSDLGMPEIDGYELIRRVRARRDARWNKIPAVALTALARVDDRVKALSAGYQMHVSKPVEPVEILNVVASLASLNN